MTLKKLALASAIAVAPMASFAEMVELEDTTLSGMTGQDGIEIVIATGAPIGADVYIHDTDGFSSTGGTFAGAIVISNFTINTNLTLNIDAGDASNAGSAPVLNIGVGLSNPTTITTGTISVANSQRDDVASGWSINTNTSPILSDMTIILGATTMNIQLGNEPQGNMIALNTAITNGLTINNFALNDASVGGGAIGAASINMRDTGGGANLNVVAGVNVTSAGLVVGITQLGTLAGGMDVRITDQYLGTTTAGIIGDITVAGLQLAGTTITISGK